MDQVLLPYVRSGLFWDVNSLRTALLIFLNLKKKNLFMKCFCQLQCFMMSNDIELNEANICECYSVQFHVPQLTLIRFTQQNLCCISKSTKIGFTLDLP